MKVLKFLGIALILMLTAAIIILFEGDIPEDVVDARYASPASRFLDLGESGRIHYRDEGNRRDSALVLLHGSNASLHTWEPWVARLSSEFRVISLDLPGHGLTGEVPSGDYSHSAYVRVLDSLLTHLGVDRFVLAGNSMGGSVAWQYALEQPHRLNGLVLIAAGPPFSWYENEGDRNAVVVFSLLREAWFRTIAEKLDIYYVTVQGVRAAYNNSPVVDEALIMRYYDLNMRAGSRRATMARFGQTIDGEEPDLSQIETPTLIMWGKEDALVSMEIAKKFELTISNTVTAYYDDVGHIPMEEIPDRSADDLIKFLKGLKP